MRKFTILLAVAALAASPSLALAKAKHHKATHHAKVAKQAKPAQPQGGLNENTFRLFNNMFAGK